MTYDSQTENVGDAVRGGDELRDDEKEFLLFLIFAPFLLPFFIFPFDSILASCGIFNYFFLVTVNFYTINCFSSNLLITVFISAKLRTVREQLKLESTVHETLSETELGNLSHIHLHTSQRKAQFETVDSIIPQTL